MELLHYNRRCCAYSFLHINVCVVLAAFKFSYMQNHLLFLHFLNGYSFPDGNVYPLKDSRQSQAYNSVGYFDYIPRIRSRTCGIYVLGFVKSIPVEIEEAADVDGAGPLRTFFGIVLPIMKPTFISVAILETMWIWNDYLLPYLILDMDYKTIPIHIQYLNGSYGHTDTSAIMALIVLSIVPIIIFYFACQKYIIEGVVSGAVKG